MPIFWHFFVSNDFDHKIKVALNFGYWKGNFFQSDLTIFLTPNWQKPRKTSKFGNFWPILQFQWKGTELSISKRESVKDNFYNLSSTLLIPGSNHPNICLPMEARPESGISLGDTEELRGQIYSHPDFQVFL